MSNVHICLIGLAVLLIICDCTVESLKKKRKRKNVIHKKSFGKKFHRTPGKYEYDTDLSPTRKPGFTIPEYDYFIIPENYDWPKKKNRKREDSVPGDGAFEDFEALRDFNNWPDWIKVGSCSVEKNPSLSPVDIPIDQAKLDKSLPALFVYSKYPKEKTYYITTQLREQNSRMEVVSIVRRNDDVLRDVTYITGLGSWDQRFFESAAILFHSPDGNLEANRSLHRLGGTEFKMEVVFLFGANGAEPEKTQIHVLVNVTDQDNPAWTPIIDMLRLEIRDTDKLWEKVRHEGCTRPDKSKERFEEFQKAQLAEKKVRLKLRKFFPRLGMENAEPYYRDLLNLYEEIKSANPEELEALNSTIDGLLKDVETMSKEAKRFEAGKKRLDQNMKNLTQEIEVAEAEMKKDTFQTMNKAVKSSWISSVEKKKKEKENLHERISLQIAKIFGKEAQKDKVLKNITSVKEKYKELMDNLARFQIGPQGRYKSVAEVKQKIDGVTPLMETWRNYSKKHKRADLKMSLSKQGNQRKALIQDPFQISWLFPPIGGYYMYYGSGIISPCNRRAFTIVMEKQITISKRQLKVIQSFPSVLQSGLWIPDGPFCDSNQYDATTNDMDMLKTMLRNVKSVEKIKDQVPIINEFDVKRRNLRYCRKNLQYMDDDGYHMRSKLRYRIKHNKDKDETEEDD